MMILGQVLTLPRAASLTRFGLALAAAGALAGAANAQITHLEAIPIDGPHECPAPALGAFTPSGSGNYTLNTGTNVLSYNITFGGLTSNQISGHIHGFSGVCPGSGGILFALGLGPVSGTFATTAAQNPQILASQTYTNIHTNNNPGGEIRGQIVPSPALGSAFCAGDGSIGPCPCGNMGTAGNGCDNSSATGGALLKASGHTSPDNVVLICQGETGSVPSIFLQGDTIIAPANFGDGLRCIGGVLKRLSVEIASSGWVAYPEAADASITSKSAALGDPIAPGSTRHYQTYYRDSTQGFCDPPVGNTWNVSSAVTITW